MTTGFAAPQAETSGFPLSRPLVSGSRIGSFVPLLQQTFVANTDTVIPINLGRMPSGYHQIRTPAGGGQLTDGSLAGADWNPSQIVLQATVAGIYSFLVM